jgi:hypothetical protein
MCNFFYIKSNSGTAPVDEVIVNTFLTRQPTVHHTTNSKHVEHKNGMLSKQHPSLLTQFPPFLRPVAPHQQQFPPVSPEQQFPPVSPHQQ